MWGSDLSGIEARLLGHYTYSFDGGEMAHLLLEGDVHTKTAVAMGISRNTAKTLRYAISYGAGVGKVSSILSCSTKEAEKAIDLFYEANPALKLLVDYLKKFYKKYKYIRAIDGRRLYIRSEHILLNSLIQGSAAVLFKAWGIGVWRMIDEIGIDAEITIMVHDELDGRIIKGVREEMSKLLKDALKEVEVEYKLKVELETQTKFGNSWAQVH